MYRIIFFFHVDVIRSIMDQALISVNRRPVRGSTRSKLNVSVARIAKFSTYMVCGSYTSRFPYPRTRFDIKSGVVPMGFLCVVICSVEDWICLHRTAIAAGLESVSWVSKFPLRRWYRPMTSDIVPPVSDSPLTNDRTSLSFLNETLGPRIAFSSATKFWGV